MSSESANEFSISGSVELELDFFIGTVKASREVGYKHSRAEAEETS
jgi:hypothetical protein